MDAHPHGPRSERGDHTHDGEGAERGQCSEQGTGPRPPPRVGDPQRRPERRSSRSRYRFSKKQEQQRRGHSNAGATITDSVRSTVADPSVLRRDAP